MNDAQAAADQHQKHLILGEAGEFGDQAGIAGKSDAGGIDGGFVVRAADDAARLSGADGSHRGAEIGNGRTASLGIDAARCKMLLRQGIDGEQANAGPVRRYIQDRQRRRDELAVMFHHVTIADQHDRGAFGFKRMGGGLDGDFGADAVWVAKGDGDGQHGRAHSGIASKVSKRELSQTTMRSTIFGASPLRFQISR